jgi:glycosyltransferase involved in cell wall biosynthesis
MLTKPLISILIPVFNREAFIEETLNSIITQTYKNWECIIVDDGSSDNTLPLLEAFKIKDSRIKVYNRPDNLDKGANSCRNYAFKVCKGDYINWFDSDDIMHPEFLKTKLEAFNDEINCVISKTQFFSENINTIIGKENRTFSSENLLEDFITLKRSWYVCDPMWKKSFLKKENLFSLHLLKGQDRDFHVRMLQNTKIQISFVDIYLTYYRQHGQTISNTFTKAVALSINNNLKERIEQLVKYGISNKTLLFMYLQLFKNYRNLQSQTLKTLFFVLKKPILNLDYFKWILKFLLASISYRLVGKGDVLLS